MLNPDASESRTERIAEPPPAAPSAQSPVEADVLLARIEKSLAEVRGHMLAVDRASRHRDFSFALLAGGLAQAVVVALLLWALTDVIFNGGTSNPTPLGVPLIKLAFAGVLQLIALTSFIAPRAG